MPTRPVASITLKKAVSVAEMSMVLQRQTYKFDSSMYDRGVYNAKTNNAKIRYDQLTQAIELLKSLVSSNVVDPPPVYTKP